MIKLSCLETLSILTPKPVAAKNRSGLSDENYEVIENTERSEMCNDHLRVLNPPYSLFPSTHILYGICRTLALSWHLQCVPECR